MNVCSELLNQLCRRFGSKESNHFPAVSTLLDSHLKKIAFRDPTAAQQGVDWIVQEMSSVSALISPVPRTGSDSPFTYGKCLMVGWHQEEEVLMRELKQNSTWWEKDHPP